MKDARIPTKSSLKIEATPPPFFIVGSGRSGSTLLRMMLAAHSRIAIPPETWFMLPLLKRFSVDRPLSAEEMDQAIGLMTGHYRWPDMKLSVTELRRRVAGLRETHLSGLVGVVYGAQLEVAGKVRWGDKTPPYIQILPKLAALFPGSKFIYLVRDGRDVSKSFQSLGMYGPWLHDNTVEWRDASYWARKWMNSGYADRILQVRYEDLVLDAEGALRRVCAFLGEAFESRMLSWQDEVGRLVPAREMHVHQKLKRESRREDINRWKTEMSAREVFVTEAFMFGHLDRYGYVRRFRSAVWIPVFWMTRVYCVLFWPSLPFRALRWLRRSTRQGRAAKREKVGRTNSAVRATKTKSSSSVPLAVSWPTRSWRGFFR